MAKFAAGRSGNPGGRPVQAIESTNTVNVLDPEARAAFNARLLQLASNVVEHDQDDNEPENRHGTGEPEPVTH